MLTLLEQLDKGTLWPSHGGTHPPEMKFISNATPISSLPLAEQYLIPVPQVNDCAILAVKEGDSVYKGQCLTQGTGRQYLPVHAPTSGFIKAIEPRPSNHASGLPVLTLELIPDGKEQWFDGYNKDDPASIDSFSNEEIIARVQAAGVVGMGGAEFPSHVKLTPTSDIELLIINGAECEPYLTSDDKLMQEHSEQIIAGASIIYRILKPKRVIVAIEDNKPIAIRAMEKALAKSNFPKGTARVTVIPTKYPSGSAKQLIKIITGQEVASGGRSSQLGILVHNVATAMAIHQAVTQNKPSIERVVTVTGRNVTKPGNYWVPIGTPINHLLKYCGFKPEKNQQVIIGGPMMGFTLPLINVPVLKGTTAVLVPSSQEISYSQEERACIRCGECAQVCPASLLPQQLFWHAKAQEYDKAAAYNLKDCIECGCCSYVCPSDIPLVEYYRIAKSAIKQTANEKVQAELAKQRYEARLKRLEEEKIAREEKAKQASAKRQSSMKSEEKDAVAAALARIQAKKAVQAAVENSLSSESKEKEKASTSTEDPKAKVAAAIARAKAKKAAAQAQIQTPIMDDSENSQLEKHNSVASAIPSTTSTSDDNTTDESKADDRKAKVAAAIARAKAKKAALAKQEQNNQQIDSPSQATEPLPEMEKSKSANENAEESAKVDDKKARIAAAVAKAKAKKAAQAKQNKE